MAIAPAEIAQFIRNQAPRFGLHPQLVLAVAQVESGLRHYNTRGQIVTSPAGAMGVMQVMPLWERWAKERGWNIRTPEGNLLAGMAILRQYIGLENGNITNGLRRYNGGNRWRNIPATVNYARKVQSRMATNQDLFVHPVVGAPRTVPGGEFGAQRRTGIHRGIDFAVAMGTPVVSVIAGRVKRVADLGARDYGRYIVVQGNDGREYYYAHLSAQLVKPGQEVSAGQVIGKVGSTGNSTGPHLHFEIRQKGQHLNPTRLLQGAMTASGEALAEPEEVPDLDTAVNLLAQATEPLFGIDRETLSELWQAFGQELARKLAPSPVEDLPEEVLSPDERAQAQEIEQPQPQLDRLTQAANTVATMLDEPSDVIDIEDQFFEGSPS